jgi:uncharacterized membrane protein
MKDQFSSTGNPGTPAGECAMPAAARDSKTKTETLAIGTFGALGSGTPAARVHGYHSLAFLILSLAVYGLLSLCRSMFEPVLPILPLAWMAGYAFLLWNAYNGHPRMFPVVRSIAERMAGMRAEGSVTKTD